MKILKLNLWEISTKSFSSVRTNLFSFSLSALGHGNILSCRKRASYLSQKSVDSAGVGHAPKKTTPVEVEMEQLKNHVAVLEQKHGHLRLPSTYEDGKDGDNSPPPPVASLRMQSSGMQMSAMSLPTISVTDDISSLSTLMAGLFVLPDDHQVMLKALDFKTEEVVCALDFLYCNACHKYSPNNVAHRVWQERA